MRALAYRRLAESMARGEFERNGRSLVLLLFPELVASVPPHRLTSDYFRGMVEAYGVTNFSSDSGLVRENLWFCWLPSDLCREWFRRHHLAWPEEFNPQDQTLDARPGRYEKNPKIEVSASVPDAVAPKKGRRGRKPGSGSFDDEEALLEMLRLLASNKAKSVHAATRCVVTSGMAKRIGSEESVVNRLRNKFAARFGTQPPSGKTWGDIAVELEPK